MNAATDPVTKVGAVRADLLTTLESEVGVLIRRVKRVIGQRAQSVDPDLAPASYLVLAFVAEQGPVRATTFVDRFAIDKGAISRHLHHLEGLDLIERHPDPDDGRAFLVGPTPHAVSRLEAVRAERRRWLDARLGDWSDEQLEEFVSALGRYNAALD